MKEKLIYKKYSLRTILSIVATIILLVLSLGDLKEIPKKIIKQETLPAVNIPSETLALTMMPDDKTRTLLSLIENSEKSLELVMYDLKDKAVSDALISAQNRGVKVRVLLNKGYYGKKEDRNEQSYNYLSSKDIPARWAPEYFALTHQKTLVVDDKIAYIMTFNLVPKYYPTGRDFGIINTNKNDVDAILETFNADWEGKKVESQNGDSLLWSPGAEDETIALINRAQKTLIVYNELMNHQKITDALVAQAQKGVDVRIVMTYASNWREAFAQLRNAGVHIRTYEGKKGLYIHTKMIISDSNYGYIGSQNFSENSLNKNRELGMLFTDPQLIQQLESVFKEDWGKGKDF